MTTAQPMTSTKIATGEYAVLGTSSECIVKRRMVYRHMGGGFEWVLYVNGERRRTFDTKRDALVYCQTDVTL